MVAGADLKLRLIVGLVNLGHSKLSKSETFDHQSLESEVRGKVADQICRD